MTTGRGRRAKTTVVCQVFRDVLCARGHRVGMAWRFIPPDPRTRPQSDPSGYHYSKMAFVDTPAGGKVERECPVCGDPVRVRWQRIVDALDEGERDGKLTGVFTTFCP